MSLLKIDSVVYEPPATEDGVDDFPAFVVSGIFTPTGERFVRRVSILAMLETACGMLALMGEKHVSGLDLDQAQDGQLSKALYEAVAGCTQYQEMAAEYHGG